MEEGLFGLIGVVVGGLMQALFAWSTSRRTDARETRAAVADHRRTTHLYIKLIEAQKSSPKNDQDARDQQSSRYSAVVETGHRLSAVPNAAVALQSERVQECFQDYVDHHAGLASGRISSWKDPDDLEREIDALRELIKPKPTLGSRLALKSKLIWHALIGRTKLLWSLVGSRG